MSTTANHHRYESQLNAAAEEKHKHHELTYNQNKQTGTVNVEMLRVRGAAEEDAPVICMVKQGEILVTDKSLSTDDFYKVSTPQGLSGFVKKEFVDLKED